MNRPQPTPYRIVVVALVLSFGIAAALFVLTRDAQETAEVKTQEAQTEGAKADAATNTVEAICKAGDEAACQLLEQLDAVDEVDTTETQDDEIQEREIQEREIQEREIQEREIQEREEQERERQEREIQDPEIDDPEPDDPPIPGNDGRDGKDGTNGADGEDATDEQVDASVVEYCSARNECLGKDGAPGPAGSAGPPGTSATCEGDFVCSGELDAALTAALADYFTRDDILALFRALGCETDKPQVVTCSLVGLP